jgi:hypothetical protein
MDYRSTLRWVKGKTENLLGENIREYIHIFMILGEAEIT